MRKFLKNLILIAIMTLTSIDASADRYERAWKLVDRSIEQDLPESAAAKVNEIFDMAAADHDSKQLLKSAIYMSRIESMMAGDNLSSSIDLFNSLLPKLGQSEYKAICHALLAKSYIKYWNRNRSAIVRNLPQTSDVIPLDKLTPGQLCDTIMAHLQLSIDKAGNAPGKWFEDFFPGGNKEGMKLRPTLTDLLLDNAITPISGQKLNKGQLKMLSDRRLYGTGPDFVEATLEIDDADPDLWELHVLNLLTARHLESKPDIRSTIDSRRMDVLGNMLDSNGREQWSYADSLWVDGLVHMAESYGKKISFASVFLSKAAARILDSGNMSDEQESRYMTLASKLCRKAIEVWPKSEGAFECMKMLSSIEEKELSLVLPYGLTSGSSSLAYFEYRNVGTVYFKAVEVAGEIKDATVPEILDRLAAASTASEWKVVTGSPKDNVIHYAVTRIPPLMPGQYYIVASTGSNFGPKDIISFAHAECSAMTFVQMGTSDGSSIEGYVVNSRTGQPEIGVRYNLWETDWSGNQTRRVRYGFADDNGYILIEGLNSLNYNLELSRGDDVCNCTGYVNGLRDMPQEGIARIYTDRYTYRPGDSIQFAVLYYSRHGLNSGKVIADAPVTVSLRNASSKETGSVTMVTDSMGMAMGSIVIPADAMPGRFSLRAVAGEQGENATVWCSVNVENFNQSKFSVELDAASQLTYYDREICLTGSVRSNTGQTVGGATVQWSAGLTGSNAYIFMPRTDAGDARLAGGQTVTDADGRFSLRFTVPEDITVSDYGPTPVHIQVFVTDVNGETRTADASVMVGQGSRSILSTFDDALVPAGGMDVIVAPYDFNSYSGKLLKGKVHAVVSGLEGTCGGIELNRDRWASGLKKRYLEELTESAARQELAGYFPRYCLDFTGRTVKGAVLVDETLESGDRPASLHIPISRSGEYEAVFESELAETYTIRAKCMLENDHEWVPDGSLLFALAESDTVNVGDTAVIRLGNRQAGSVILYSVIDRLGMNRHGTLESAGRQMRLEIPVDKSMEGGFIVHLYCTLDNVDEYKDFYFVVPYASHTLKVEASHGSDTVRPGDELDWSFSISNNDGSPAVGRILIDMYDSALDAYGIHSWNLQPWNSVRPYVSPLRRSYYSQQYNPGWFSASESRPYSGKVALTGVLLDPLAGYEAMETAVLRSTMHLRGVAKNADMMMDEEVLPEPSDAEQLPVADIDALRTDLNPTGLFAFAQTDSLGRATASFTAPQLLTKWHVRAIMWSDSLSVGRVEFDKITAKDIMIEPAAPRFVRQGDVLDFSFKIMNSTGAGMDVKAGIELTDAVLGSPVRALAGGRSSAVRTVYVPACGSAMAVFRITVPKDGLQALEYTLSATCGSSQDALRQTLPVLSSRIPVTEAISLFNNGNETRSFSFDRLKQPLSADAADERMVLEYSTTPMWYAIQCLPSLIRTDDPSSLRLAHSIMGNASAINILRRYPDVRDMVSQWALQPAGRLESRLERNSTTSGILAENTPWYMQSQNEKERLHMLGSALNGVTLESQLDESLFRLAAMHIDGAGWPWMNGMAPDIHITTSILDCLGRLRENGALVFDTDMEKAVCDALSWLDAQFAREMEADDKPEQLYAQELSYLLVLQRLDDLLYSNRRSDVHKFFLDIAGRQDTRNMNLMERAQLVIVLLKTDAGRAEHVVQTMLERSVLEDEMGRYWKDNKSGYRWQDAPIEAQSLAIEALQATGHEQEAVECSRWLLKQRQTGDWGSSAATSHAVSALLATAGGSVQMSPDITVNIGTGSFTAAYNSSCGYMKVELPGRAEPSASDITVQSRSEGISWGAVYYMYTDLLENVAGSANGMTLERSLWRVAAGNDGEILQPVGNGEELRVGDRMRVRLRLKTTRAVEYVRLRDMWAAGFEPESTSAGWRGGLFSRGYYMAPGNTGMDFYFDRLEEGSVELEYDMFVQKAGIFQAGRAEVQCLYSPDMRSGTGSQKVIVEQ